MTWLDSLPTDLPAGRLIAPDGSRQPVFWISAHPAKPGQWSHWRARHAATGLWPVLVMEVQGSDDPFALDAEDREAISDADQHPGSTVLEDWWHYLVEDDLQDEGVDLDYLEPFESTWPGVCPSLPAQGQAEHFADQYADTLLGERVHLGLIPAASGADAPTALGGPVRSTTTTTPHYSAPSCATGSSGSARLW